MTHLRATLRHFLAFALLSFIVEYVQAWHISVAPYVRQTLRASEGSSFSAINEDGYASSTFVVTPSDTGIRLDRFLSQNVPDQSRSYLGSLCAKGHVTRRSFGATEGGGTLLRKKSQKLRAGDLIDVLFVQTEEFELVPENIPLDVLYEDEDVIVVNKAIGMVVHPAPGNWNGTLVNALAYHFSRQQQHPEAEGDNENDMGRSFENSSSSILSPSSASEKEKDIRPGIVHRLDKGTSGAIIVAKNTEAQARLSACFKERRVTKTYLAVCVGEIPASREPMPIQQQRRATSITRGDRDVTGKDTPIPNRFESELVVNKPVGRHPVKRHQMDVIPESHGGRSAVSRVSTLGYNGRLTLARVGIETGRTHQIRVHLAHLRHPILGDDVYGFNDWNLRAAAGKLSLSPLTDMSKRQRGSTSALKVKRPLLHAAELVIPHPATGRMKEKPPTELRIVCPPPSDVSVVAEAILGKPLEMRDYFEVPENSLWLSRKDMPRDGATSSTVRIPRFHSHGSNDGDDNITIEHEDDGRPELINAKMLAQAEAEGWY